MGLLQTIRAEKIIDYGGYNQIKLRQLASAYVAGDGDTGICFEYAVHEAIRSRHTSVCERIEDALRRCNMPTTATASLLFGAEKSGRISLIDSVSESLTDDSSLMVGSRGRPVKLKRHINSVMAAFRSQQRRLLLPNSISGLWKADLFVGDTGADKWVGTTVKINQNQLEGARGLRLAIVPCRQGISDGITVDENRNLIVTPVPYDMDFMESFLTAVQAIKFFFHRDARMPTEGEIPNSAARRMVRELYDRREVPVVELIDILGVIAQPGLLRREQSELSSDVYRPSDDNDVEGMLSPVPSLAH